MNVWEVLYVQNIYLFLNNCEKIMNVKITQSVQYTKKKSKEYKKVKLNRLEFNIKWSDILIQPPHWIRLLYHLVGHNYITRKVTSAT